MTELFALNKLQVKSLNVISQHQQHQLSNQLLTLFRVQTQRKLETAVNI